MSNLEKGKEDEKERRLKTHLLTNYKYYMACGRYHFYTTFETYNRRKVTCESCRNTKEFRKRRK